MRKTSPLFIVGFVAVLLIGLYGGYVFFQQRSAIDTSEKNDLVIKELQADVLKLEQDRVLEAISAKKTADQINQDAIRWSEIIKKLRNTIPKDSGDRIAEITSYTGSSTSGLSLSIKTVEGRNDPYLDVADVIEAFTESEYFDGSFVPGISSGLNERGEEILTFSMNTLYLGDDFLVEDDLSGAINEVLDDALGEEESEAISR